jgi:hypothetical protein
MPQAGFKPTIQMFKRSKTGHALYYKILSLKLRTVAYMVLLNVPCAVK